MVSDSTSAYRFQSTLPLRGATDPSGIRLYNVRISIHAPLTGSDSRDRAEILQDFISIHAPLTGSDRGGSVKSLFHPDFNPRSPYGERQPPALPQGKQWQFQSTLPLRGATSASRPFLHKTENFNPRSPYGERRLETWERFGSYIFQSTLPLRGATRVGDRLSPHGEISIHAPLTGSDRDINFQIRKKTDFNPRSPYGERPLTRFTRSLPATFQSTLPLRGATFVAAIGNYGYADFNPRSPYGERPGRHTMRMPPCVFQSTLPLRGATADPIKIQAVGPRFQSTLPLRGATGCPNSLV